MGVRASYYEKLTTGLARAGVSAAAVDLPGLGESRARAGWQSDWGYQELMDHYAAACDAVRATRPDADLFLLGHSLGGQVALLLAGKPIRNLRGVMLVASGSPWWRAWDGTDALKIRVSTAACDLLARSLGHYPGHRLGFGGREPRALIRQWASIARTGSYDLDGLEGESLLAAAGPPTLALHLAGDTFAPEKAIRSTLERLTSRETQLEHWRDAPYGGDHNRWPSAPNHVVQRALRFIARRRSTAPRPAMT